MNKSVIRIAISVFTFLLSVIAVILFENHRYASVEENYINLLVKSLTAGYRWKQIVATVIMFCFGRVISIPLCKHLDSGYSFFVAMPIGNLIWCLASYCFLILNIPYVSYLISVAIGIGAVLYVYFFREDYKYVINNLSMLFAEIMFVLSLSIMASAGVFAIFTSSDSYYYVMQYGELIVQSKKLSFDIVGTFMTCTGISPALISSYAAMWGFENIYAIHYLLIFSMYGFIAYIVYMKARRFSTAKISCVYAIIAFLSVLMAPPVSFLSIWIISNAYFMVYVVFLIMIPVIAEDKIDGRLIGLVSLFSVWLTLSRIEAAPIVCFFIICISCLKISRKQFAVLFLMIVLVEASYLLKLLFEYWKGNKEAARYALNGSTAMYILLAIGVTGIYLIVYNLKFVNFIRVHLFGFGVAFLLLSCLIAWRIEPEIFVRNIKRMHENLGQWYWAYIPVAILIVGCLKILFRCRNAYLDIVFWGFILLNLIACIKNTVRVGVGSSYNRICMSIVPLYIISTIYTFLDYFEKEKKIK